jgi:hypothetical protein
MLATVLIFKLNNIMKKETIRITSNVCDEYWNPSVQLRWVERNNGTMPNGDYKVEKVLQQLHTSNLGNREWKDVPTETQS